MVSKTWWLAKAIFQSTCHFGITLARESEASQSVRVKQHKPTPYCSAPGDASSYDS